MSCQKHRYRDRIAVTLALARAQRSDAPKRRERRAYRCPACKGWHLTSQEKNGARA